MAKLIFSISFFLIRRLFFQYLRDMTFSSRLQEMDGFLTGYENVRLLAKLHGHSPPAAEQLAFLYMQYMGKIFIYARACALYCCARYLDLVAGHHHHFSRNTSIAANRSKDHQNCCSHTADKRKLACLQLFGRVSVVQWGLINAKVLEKFYKRSSLWNFHHDVFLHCLNTLSILGKGKKKIR